MIARLRVRAVHLPRLNSNRWMKWPQHRFIVAEPA